VSWSLDQLNAFVYSAELGSFSAAARRLGKVQSRISTAVADLEIDLGVLLFHRQGHKPILTDAGEKLLHQARSVLKQNERLMAQAEQLVLNRKTHLSLALDESLPLNPFEDLLVLMAEKYPYLTLNLLSGTQQDIANWVDQGIADLGILFYFFPMLTTVDFVSLGQIEQQLIVASDHPLSKKSPILLADLMEYRQLVIRDRNQQRLIEPISSQHWWVDNYYYITSLVCRGVGWALVPNHVIEFPWFENGLTRLSVDNLPQVLGMEMGIVKRRSGGKSEEEVWFCQRITKMMKDGYSVI
jgi:DNA-binding transcriptional LysR family regulator